MKIFEFPTVELEHLTVYIHAELNDRAFYQMAYSAKGDVFFHGKTTLSSPLLERLGAEIDAELQTRCLEA